MAFIGINYIAVVIAAMAGWLVGAGWYRALARPWLIALGKTRSELHAPSGKPSPVPFMLSLAAQLVMAYILAGLLIGHLGPGKVTLLNGIVAGFVVWLGFVVTTLMVNYGFARHRPMLALIDGGHWLAVLVIQGAIIGVFGPSIA